MCNNGYLLESFTFTNLSSGLRSIQINDFVVHKLTAGHFERFVSLEALAISDSRIAEIDEHSFVGLTKLQVLNLAGNHIEHLPESLFDDLISLERLNLSHNLITELPENLFKNTTNSLRSLDLSRNRLCLLNGTIFDTLVNLENLDLSNNELTYILPGTFDLLRNIHVLDISNNLLVTLHEDLFDFLNKTGKIQLSISRNPLVCNCGLIWLREALLNTMSLLDLVNPSAILCSTPHIVHNKKLAEIPLEQLSCTSPFVTISQSPGPHYYHNQVGVLTPSPPINQHCNLLPLLLHDH